MTEVVWLIAFAAVALYGGFVFRFPYVRSLEWPARIAIAVGVGTTVCGAVMFVYSIAGIAWSRTSLGIPMLIGAAFVAREWRTGNLARPGQAGLPALHKTWLGPG